MVTALDPSLTVRLLLEPAQLTALRASLPPGMGESQQPAALDEQVLASLRARAVIGPNGQVHRSVLAGLVLLTDPAAVRISVVAAGPALVRRTSIALSDQLLAGLTVEEPGGRAEQFLARTGDVTNELVRLLPVLPVDATPDRVGVRDVEPGLLLVALEREPGVGDQKSWEDFELGGGTDLVRAFAAGFVGSLSVTLSMTAGAVVDEPVLDRLLWVATSGGWWSLRPHSDRSGRPRLDVIPVQPDELVSELAPILAAVALGLGGGP